MRISDWSSDVCSSDLRSSPMTDVAAGRYAGTRVHRVEDARLLTGRGTFVDDVDRPGMLHACFVRSPFARARIGEIDASEALALPGVHAVLTAADITPGRSEERRVGKGWVSTCRHRWWPYN